MRILVAVERAHRAYAEVVARAFQMRRSCLEVAVADLDTLDDELQRFKPLVVVSDRPTLAAAGSWLAWVELSLEPQRPTKVWLGGRLSEKTNPGLEDLLEVIDTTAKLSASRDAQ